MGPIKVALATLAVSAAILGLGAGASQAQVLDSQDPAAPLRLELEIAEIRGKEVTADLPIRLDASACVENTISYSRTTNDPTSRTGTIDNTDCVTSDGGTLFDIWNFSGRSGDRIRIDLERTSGDLDPFLLLLNPLGNVFEDDDDGGDGLDSRIVTTLDRNGEWQIGASGLPGFNQTGGYRLTIRCQNCSPAPSQCVKSSTTLCLNDDRFQVRVDWRDFEGNTGLGTAVPGASNTSANLWFFQPDNWELLVKVLDACPVNNRYWVFFAATTNVQFTVTVTDTQTQAVKTYFNPLGQSADAITDTQAFATCP
ncbi:MAG TPA: hypothetical protein VMT85_08595 [Thermoanaerobaculia bacterium]|nr:hypothetical protein [Thermoanaerobaculia bacterium]